MAGVVVAHADGPYRGAAVVMAHGGDEAVDFIVDGGKDSEGHMAGLGQRPQHTGPRRQGLDGERPHTPSLATGAAHLSLC
ncbi:hypothetical protein CBM2595_A90034 [Cupriavidus taiwanensis]|nr:hypothetical protein CBM2595_A90034 [Cupriavidus taiwanensis]